jgi:hypothetical protein
MYGNEKGGVTLNDYDITSALAAVESFGSGSLMKKLAKRIERSENGNELPLSPRESVKVARAVGRAASSKYYIKQNELSTTGLLRQLEENGYKNKIKQPRRRIF